MSPDDVSKLRYNNGLEWTKKVYNTIYNYYIYIFYNGKKKIITQ